MLRSCVLASLSPIDQGGRSFGGRPESSPGQDSQRDRAGSANRKASGIGPKAAVCGLLGLGAIMEELLSTSTPPGLRVLVVDDDELLVGGLLALLEAEGFDAEGALTAEAGLERIAERRPDIVLLDLMLPRMSGYQFMEALVTRCGRSRPKVIVMSAAHRLDLARARLGAEGYIAKPAEPDRLRAALRRVALPLYRARTRSLAMRSSEAYERVS